MTLLQARAAFSCLAVLLLSGCFGKGDHPAPLVLVPAWQASGEDPGSAFGTRAMCAGDVNGDGFSDLIVGSPRFHSNQGKVYLFLGSKKGLGATASWTATGVSKDDLFGDRVGQAGDVNGDGFGDFFVSAPGWKAGLGHCVVFYGSRRGPGREPDWEVTPSHAGEIFGDCTHPTGDLDGDGYDDLAVGAYGYDQNRGRILLYRGSAHGLAKNPVWQAQGEAKHDWYGYGVGAAGDVNGDGIDDLLAGAKYNRDGGPGSGKAYLYLGVQGGHLGPPAWTWRGAPKSNATVRVATAGDINGDGYADVLVSAPGENGALSELNLFWGGPQGLKPVPDQVLRGGELGLEFFGEGACPAGDVDGDGYDDLAVSGRDARGIGKVLVYRGSPAGLESFPSWEMDGQVAGDRFGKWIAPAGDLDGDGLADLVLCSDAGGPGSVYVVYGWQFRESLGQRALPRRSSASGRQGYLRTRKSGSAQN